MAFKPSSAAKDRFKSIALTATTTLQGYSMRQKAILVFVVMTASSFLVISQLSVNFGIHFLSPTPPSFGDFDRMEQSDLIYRDEYDIETCSRLDSPLEHQSPPDFSKLGIDSWTDCKTVEALDGWKVEHCTAPASAWGYISTRNSRQGHTRPGGPGGPRWKRMMDENDGKGQSKKSLLSKRSGWLGSLLAGGPPPPPPPPPSTWDRAGPFQPDRKGGRMHAPPGPGGFPPPPPPPPPRGFFMEDDGDEPIYTRPNHCDPSGYFRIQRLETPSTDITYGSDHPDPLLRCRNNLTHPISLNETTRSYIENFAGPDIFRVELLGPERILINQQLNLGNCTYGLPYLASRPGRFYLNRIDHVYEDFKGLNENPGDSSSFPDYLGNNILSVGLPPVPTPKPTIVVMPVDTEKEKISGEDAMEDLDQEYPPELRRELTEEETWDQDRIEIESKVYHFLVCGGCPEYHYPHLMKPETELPHCPTSALSGSRQYGIYVATEVIENRFRGSIHDYIWATARPRCRLFPDLSSFQNETTFLNHSLPVELRGLEKYIEQEGGTETRIQPAKVISKKPIRGGSNTDLRTGIGGGSLFHSDENNPPNDYDSDLIAQEDDLEARLDARTRIMTQYRLDHDVAMACLNRPRSVYFVGDSHNRLLFSGFVQRMEGRPGDTVPKFVDWGTHNDQVGQMVIRQEFDRYFTKLLSKTRHMLDLPLGEGRDEIDDDMLNLLDTYDTMVFDFGHWAAAGFGIGRLWNSHEVISLLEEIIMNLAKIRIARQDRFKLTGTGFRDLKIIWLGMTPWPDRSTRLSPDMRTNPRLKYWDILTNDVIDRVNNMYGTRGGVIDRLDAFNMDIPFREKSADGAHYNNERPVNSMIQVLLHKFDICGQSLGTAAA